MYIIIFCIRLQTTYYNIVRPGIMAAVLYDYPSRVICRRLRRGASRAGTPTNRSPSLVGLVVSIWFIGDLYTPRARCGGDVVVFYRVNNVSGRKILIEFGGEE